MYPSYMIYVYVENIFLCCIGPAHYSLSYMYRNCLKSFMRAIPVLNKYACKKQCITFDFWAEKRMMILDNLGVAQVTTETFVLTIIIFEKKTFLFVSLQNLG